MPVPHQAIKLKYFFYRRFVSLRLLFFARSFSIFLYPPRSSVSLFIYLLWIAWTSTVFPFSFIPTFQPRCAFFFLSFFVTSSSHLYTLSFSSTLIFLCRPLWRSRPTIRQRIKAACVRRYLRPTTPTQLLISSRGSKNMPLRPCMLSRARRGHRGYPFAGIATWVIHGWPAEANWEYSRWTKYPD